MERVALEFPAKAVIHRHPLTVRVTDMNYGRHLGHDALVSLLHEARVQAFASLGFAEWDMQGYPSVVADLAVQYQSEARWPEALVIDTAVPDAEGKALIVYQRIRKVATESLNADTVSAVATVVATARVTQLLMDTATGRPVEVPLEVRKTLRQARGA